VGPRRLAPHLFFSLPLEPDASCPTDSSHSTGRIFPHNVVPCASFVGTAATSTKDGEPPHIPAESLACVDTVFAPNSLRQTGFERKKKDPNGTTHHQQCWNIRRHHLAEVKKGKGMGWLTCAELDGANQLQSALLLQRACARQHQANHRAMDATIQEPLILTNETNQDGVEMMCIRDKHPGLVLGAGWGGWCQAFRTDVIKPRGQVPTICYPSQTAPRETIHRGFNYTIPNSSVERHPFKVSNEPIHWRPSMDANAILRSPFHTMAVTTLYPTRHRALDHSL